MSRGDVCQLLGAQDHDASGADVENPHLAKPLEYPGDNLAGGSNRFRQVLVRRADDCPTIGRLLREFEEMCGKANRHRFVTGSDDGVDSF